MDNFLHGTSLLRPQHEINVRIENAITGLLTGLEILHNPSGKALGCYCLIDEQSSSSFIDGSVLNEMNLTGYECDYTVSTIVGNKSLVHGQIIPGFSVRELAMSKWYSLPQLYQFIL